MNEITKARQLAIRQIATVQAFVAPMVAQASCDATFICEGTCVAPLPFSDEPAIFFAGTSTLDMTRGYSAPLAHLYTAIVWGTASQWLQGRLRTFFTSTPGENFTAAKRGELRESPVGRMISMGCPTLIVASIVGAVI